jgi:hypothetical protein
MARRGNTGGPGDGDWLFWILAGAIGGYVLAKRSGEPEQPANVKDVMRGMVKQYRIDPQIRWFVGRLVTGVQPQDKIGQIERIFRYVTDRIIFLNDPGGEYVGNPLEVLRTQVGDCDCKATTLSTLLEAAGFPTRFVFVPGHVYVEVEIPSDLKHRLPERAFSRVDAAGQCWVPLESTGQGNPLGWIDYEGWLQAHSTGQEEILSIDPLAA